VTTDPAPLRPVRALRRFVLVAVVVPVILTLAAVAVQLVLLPQLPDPVAIHWDAAGRANGFAPAWTAVVLTVVLGLGLPLLLAATVIRPLRRGETGFTFRFLGAVALALSVLMTVLMTASLAVQTGLGDAGDAPSIVLVLVVALVVAVLGGVAGWFAQPRAVAGAAEVAPTAPLALRPGERVVWMRTASIARGGAVALVIIVMALAAAAAVAWFIADAALAGILTATTLILAAGLACTILFHVRVDEQGLRVASAVGVPRFEIPLAEMAEVACVRVHPMAQFGGYGIRSLPGRTGVVLFTGDAIEVTRRGGKQFVVTVPDARTAVALLQALRAREKTD